MPQHTFKLNGEQVTVAGAEAVVAAARAHGIFAMEAMWTRFQPAQRQ